MLKALTRREIKDIVSESLTKILEMAYPASFNMEEFKALRSFKDRIEYCNARLPKIGTGSSRIVYKIDDEKCLKLAKNKKGIAQNQVEIDNGNDSYFSFIPAVYDSDYDGTFVEMQLCRQATPQLFQQRYGVPFGVFQCMIQEAINETSRFKHNPFAQFSEQLQEVWGKDDETCRFFSDVYEYAVQNGREAGDLLRIKNWGVDGNGDFVLIDFGFDAEVAKLYYKY